jgi:aminoglycoside phosphotransferase family enzyme/predicted kinase
LFPNQGLSLFQKKQNCKVKESVLKALLKPSTYGNDVKDVRLIQTHTSWVFLTGEFAYKIKKPVFFGFLDYTTLDARKFFCEEELRLNHRLSPEIYLEVVPIIELPSSPGHKAGRICLGGEGKIIEYAVKMKELPQEKLMTELLKQDKISYASIDEIARIVADFHQSAETGSDINQFGEIETVKFNWDENFAQTEEFIGRTISRPTFRLIKKTIYKFMLDKFDLFTKRITEEKIKQCHGDLHSKNIFIADKVHIFDGIEFNQRFSCCDTASEIAFFVMDLDFHEKHDLANFFIDRYLQYTKDYDLLRVLDFYKCYRAYVRGKVTCFNLNDKGIEAKDKKIAAKTARHYFTLAANYAKNLFASPDLIVMIGLPGVGKTHFARELAKRINAYHLRSDIIRKELLKIRLSDHHDTGYGKGIYTGNISARTYDEMYNRARIYLAQGKNCILDATFSLVKGRKAAAKIAKEFKTQFLMVYCHCPDKIVFKRMAKRKQEFDFSDANPKVYKAMKKNFDPVPRTKDVIRVDTSKPLQPFLKRIESRIHKG